MADCSSLQIFKLCILKLKVMGQEDTIIAALVLLFIFIYSLVYTVHFAEELGHSWVEWIYFNLVI